jgi:hypothetical protein
MIAAGALPADVPPNFGYVTDAAQKEAQGRLAALVPNAEHVANTNSGHEIPIQKTCPDSSSSTPSPKGSATPKRLRGADLIKAAVRVDPFESWVHSQAFANFALHELALRRPLLRCRQVVAKGAAVAVDVGVLHDPAVGDDKSISKKEVGLVLTLARRGRSDLLQEVRPRNQAQDLRGLHLLEPVLGLDAGVDHVQHSRSG